MPAQSATLHAPERQLLRILNTIPDHIVRCRSGKHRWALEEQEPGEPFPSSVSAEPAREGSYLLIEPCGRCGAEKHTLTGPGGDLYAARSWIIYPPDWVVIPGDFPRGKLTLKAEWNRRNKQNFTRLFKAADREARVQARAVGAIPFSHAGVS
jgi:hypothetical protein